jgi:hypothetical protein
MIWLIRGLIGTIDDAISNDDSGRDVDESWDCGSLGLSLLVGLFLSGLRFDNEQDLF